MLVIISGKYVSGHRLGCEQRQAININKIDVLTFHFSLITCTLSAVDVSRRTTRNTGLTFFVAPHTSSESVFEAECCVKPRVHGSTKSAGSASLGRPWFLVNLPEQDFTVWHGCAWREMDKSGWTGPLFPHFCETLVQTGLTYCGVSIHFPVRRWTSGGTEMSGSRISRCW